MRNLLGLLLIFTIGLMSCEGRKTQRQALSESIEVFKKETSLEVVLYQPETYIEREVEWGIKKKYNLKENEEPEGYAVYGYEACKVLLDAIPRAKTKDRAGILQAVSETKNYNGALGIWSFDENGDTTNTTMSGNTVENGDFKFVKVLGK